MSPSCPSCGTDAPSGTRFCTHCGHYVSGTAAAIRRRRRSPSTSAQSSNAARRTQPTQPTQQKERRHASVPPAATGDEAAAIYAQLLAALRGANAAQHDAVVAAFKSDCKRYGQGELRARAFLDRLAASFGGPLATAQVLPQLARLIPDDAKRKKLVRVHAKQTREPVDAPIRCGARRGRRGTGPAAPVAPDARTCAICSDAFDMQRRRHFCRKCGASVCHGCSPATMLLAPGQVARDDRKQTVDAAHPQRVCTICAPLLQSLQDALRAQYANCHKENPHEATTRLHLPFSRSLASACRSAADMVGNFFRPAAGADCTDRSIPAAFLQRARGLAFLTVVKAGLLLTAKVGTGVVVAKLDNGAWSAPSAIGTAGIGGGLEGGGELIEFMLIMGSTSAVKVFHRTQVNVGAGLSLAVGPYGRAALAQAAATRGAVHANYSYSHSRGLFAGVSLHGAVLSARTEMNRNFYGQHVTPEQLLSGAVPPPRAAQCLYDAMDDAMTRGARVEAVGRASQRRSSRTVAQVATTGSCSSCRCDAFVLKAFSNKCKTCAHVHRAAK